MLKTWYDSTVQYMDLHTDCKSCTVLYCTGSFGLHDRVWLKPNSKLSSGPGSGSCVCVSVCLVERVRTGSLIQLHHPDTHRGWYSTYPLQTLAQSSKPFITCLPLLPQSLFLHSYHGLPPPCCLSVCCTHLS